MRSEECRPRSSSNWLCAAWPRSHNPLKKTSNNKRYVPSCRGLRFRRLRCTSWCASALWLLGLDTGRVWRGFGGSCCPASKQPLSHMLDG